MSRWHFCSPTWASAMVCFITIACGTSKIADAKTVTTSPTALSSSTCPWLDQSLSVSRRLRMLLPKLTLSEKVSLVHGIEPSHDYGGYVTGIPSLCIPALKLNDGPAGVGDGKVDVTALPAPVAGFATWNSKLMYEYGKVIGEEAKAKGINVIFGPMINVLRDPRWGRAWETCGEDPYLCGKLGIAEIKGIQSQDVIATAKHVAAYDQEQAGRGDSIVGVRALQEIYLPPFRQAVINGNVGAIMAMGAIVNNIPANENPYLLKDTLERRWNFMGFITSDYDGARSTVGSANAGLDLSMPYPRNFGKPLLQAVERGQVTTARLNTMVSSILREEFRFGLFNHPNTGSPQAVVTSAAHTAIAMRVAEQGTVLLKNFHQLPLSRQRVRSIAVLGAAGSAYPKAVGCGSGQVNPPYVVSPLQGIKALVGSGVTVTYAQGSNPPDDPNPTDVTSLIARAVAVARKSQIAIVFADDLECEGGGIAYGPAAPPKGAVNDRHNISLGGGQDALISAVAAVNPHTIVVLNTGAPVAAPWLGKVSAVLEAWYPGQVDGNAIAAVLFGDVDPSGHTVQTWPVDEQQMPTANPRMWGPGIQRPGVARTYDNSMGRAQLFADGIFVGYRWYDANHTKPMFPFGFGLSYTHFDYSDLKMSSIRVNGVTPLRVSARVTNTGHVAGADVAQLYLGMPEVTGEPPRQLVGFQRVALAAGQSKVVHFIIKPRQEWWWGRNGWTETAGTYRVYVGDSSALADLPLRGTYTMTAAIGSRQVTISAPKTFKPGTRALVRVSLSAGGNEILRDARLSVKAPGGWRVVPIGSVTRRTLTPNAAFTAKFAVTAPAGDVAQYVTLYGTANLNLPHGAHREAHCGDDRDGGVTVFLDP